MAPENADIVFCAKRNAGDEELVDSVNATIIPDVATRACNG